MAGTMTGLTLGNRLADVFGIDYPIILAGMGGASSPELAAAISNAGGLGILGAAGCSPSELDDWIRRTRELTDKPFGVDTLLPIKVPEGVAASELRSQIGEEYWRFADEFRRRHGIGETDEAVGMPAFTRDFFYGQLDAIIENDVPVYAAGLGVPPERYVRAMHERGMKIIGVAGTTHHARKHLDAGTDVLVAQGHDAGGHNSRIGTMALIPQVVDAVGDRLPVVAAGAIADGRQLLAALVLGASGAWIGTAFLVAEEANIPRFQKERILAASEDDTMVTRTLSGKPARLLKNAWSMEFEASGLPPLPMPLMGMVASPILAAGAEAEDGEVSVPPAGQVVGMLHEIRPAKEIFERIVNEATELAGRQPWLAGT